LKYFFFCPQNRIPVVKKTDRGRAVVKKQIEEGEFNS
jgi:hypothetical protein